MQLLFERSFEYGEHEGLGLIRGSVRPIADVIPADYKIPHIGWNALTFVGEPHPIMKNIREGDHVYFVHSYYATDCDAVIDDGIWRASHGGGGGGQCVRLSVPPRKERRRRSADFAGIL